MLKIDTNQTQNMNTQNTFTDEQVAMMLCSLRADVDDLKAQQNTKMPSSKPIITAEAKAENQRLKDEIVAQKLADKLAKKEAMKKRKAEEKASKIKDKAAKKLEDDNAKASKKLADDNAKVEAKVAKEKVEAEAKTLKAVAKGPSYGQSFTKKRFNIYRNLKGDDNDFKGINGKILRMARKKAGEDTTVYRVTPENWTEEAIAHFNGLVNKWDKAALPFSPDYVEPVSKKKPAKKKANKKTLAETTVAEDTDEELVEEIPEGYTVYRRFLKSKTSTEGTWRKVSSVMMKLADKEGLVGIDQYAYKNSPAGKPFNGDIYDHDPFKEHINFGDKVIKNACGDVVGNCVASFTPVVEERKPAAPVEVEVEDKKVSAYQMDEFDEDGYKPFTSPQYFKDPLRMTRDGRVFRLEDDKFLGKYDEETGVIGDDSSSSEEDEEAEEDAFDGENDAADTETFA